MIEIQHLRGSRLLTHTPVLVFLLFWIGIPLAYFASMKNGYVEGCFPLWSGCTSISRAGRYGLSFFLFKAFVLPAATLLIVQWYLCYVWLRSHTLRFHRSFLVMAWLGVLSAISLIVYTTFLGSDGDIYRNMRRYGTILFFVFTLIAQCILTKHCWLLFKPSRLALSKIILLTLVFLDFIVFAIFKFAIEHVDWTENAAEWRSAAILTFSPMLTWLLWLQHGFHVEFKRRDN